MPYVTSIERLAREEGRQEGFQIAILKLLELKFNKVPANHKRKVGSVRDIERLSALLQAANDAKTLDEVLSLL
jgi:hypothetical protein